MISEYNEAMTLSVSFLRHVTRTFGCGDFVQLNQWKVWLYWLDALNSTPDGQLILFNL